MKYQPIMSRVDNYAMSKKDTASKTNYLGNLPPREVGIPRPGYSVYTQPGIDYNYQKEKTTLDRIHHAGMKPLKVTKSFQQPAGQNHIDNIVSPGGAKYQAFSSMQSSEVATGSPKKKFYEDNHKNLIDKIHKELDRLGVSDSMLEDEISKKNWEGSGNDGNQARLASLEKEISRLTGDNTMRKAKIDMLISETDSIERKLLEDHF